MSYKAKSGYTNYGGTNAYNPQNSKYNNPTSGLAEQGASKGAESSTSDAVERALKKNHNEDDQKSSVNPAIREYFSNLKDKTNQIDPQSSRDIIANLHQNYISQTLLKEEQIKLENKQHTVQLLYSTCVIVIIAVIVSLLVLKIRRLMASRLIMIPCFLWLVGALLFGIAYFGFGVGFTTIGLIDIIILIILIIYIIYKLVTRDPLE